MKESLTKRRFSFIFYGIINTSENAPFQLRKGVNPMKPNTIICISREFGSGGRELAQRLSEKLGIPMYDKELITRVAEEGDTSEEFVKNHEENPTYSHIFGIPIGYPAQGAIYDGILTPERLFHIQSKVIKDIAQEQGSCIFVGRCSDIILQEYKNCFTFFVHSPLENRKKRIMETEQISKKQAAKRIKQIDWERASYHDYYTKIKWGHPSNYHLTLNMGKMDMDKAVDVVVRYIQ